MDININTLVCITISCFDRLKFKIQSKVLNTYSQRLNNAMSYCTENLIRLKVFLKFILLIQRQPTRL